MSQTMWMVQGQGSWALMSYWGGGCKVDRDSRKAGQQRPLLGLGKQMGARASKYGESPVEEV